MVKNFSSLLIVTHPWDLANTSLWKGKWDIRGYKNDDEVFEMFVKRTLKKYILAKRNEGIPVCIFLGLDEFRIHPALIGTYEFVMYEPVYKMIPLLKELGVRNIEIVGFCWDICVKSLYNDLRNSFNTKVNIRYCLPTVNGSVQYFEALYNYAKKGVHPW